MLQQLLQYGFDITARTHSGQTLLMQPCTQAYAASAERVTEFLIQQGLSVRAVDNYQMTALHHNAAQSGTARTLQLLLAHGADVNARGLRNSTALHCAVMADDAQNAAVLLAAGAALQLRDSSDAAALHLAMLTGKPAVTRVLVQHSTAEQLDSMLSTLCVCCGPISTLMMCSNTAILKLLLTAGADVHAVTSSGATCLHIAARHSYTVPVLCMLIKAGADLHAVNNAGKKAAQVHMI
jgi:ankyrin repeat protein